MAVGHVLLIEQAHSRYNCAIRCFHYTSHCITLICSNESYCAILLLGLADLRDVLGAIHPLKADRTYSFANLLSIPIYIINFIQNDHSNTLYFLREVLTHWLNRNYDTQKYGVPSWRLLCAAAASPIGGADPALAEKIASDHKNGRW